MRRNPATVVILAGRVTEGLLDAVGGSMNVALVRPDDKAGGTGVGGTGAGGIEAGRTEAGGIEAAAGALRRAAGISSPYVLVTADPLSAVAAEWEAMWQVTGEARGTEKFELRAGEALASWRANQFELPDYYLVLRGEETLGEAGTGEQHPDFYLGPLRSVRPHRVVAVAAAEPTQRAAAALSALSSLRHGRWWPSLDDVIATARGFYPGSLAETESGLAASQGRLLS